MSFKLIPTAFAQESACGAGQGGINLGDCLQLTDGSTVSSVYNTPATLVNTVVTNLFAITGLVLFIMIFIAGFKFVTKGKDGMEDAKKIMTNALIGFIVMFSAYWIIQIVSLLTGVNFNITEVRYQ
jgi:uncharacterized membrane protein